MLGEVVLGSLKITSMVKDFKILQSQKPSMMNAVIITLKSTSAQTYSMDLKSVRQLCTQGDLPQAMA
jgi:hypothetical protein